jgi:glucose-1-phosphatase
MANNKILPLRDQKAEAIIFDLGGVLLNIDVRRSIDAFLKLGFADVEEKMARILTKHSGTDAPGIFQLYETGQITSAEFREGLRKYAGRDIGDEDIDRAWTAMLLDLPPGNIRLLEKLSGSYKLFLLSNTNAIHIETMLDKTREDNGFSNMVNLFNKVYYSHVVGMRKPELEIFRFVIEDAALDPKTTVLIDDSIHNIEGAKASGLMAIHHQSNTSIDRLFQQD